MGAFALVWVMAYAILTGKPQVRVLLLSLIILSIVLLIAGLSWALASLGAFLRDVSQFIGVVVTTLMFLSPVFHPVSVLQKMSRHILCLKLLTPVIEMNRGHPYWGKLPDFALPGIYRQATGVIALPGFAWFKMTRKGIPDVR